MDIITYALLKKKIEDAGGHFGDSAVIVRVATLPEATQDEFDKKVIYQVGEILYYLIKKEDGSFVWNAIATESLIDTKIEAAIGQAMRSEY